ncbi:MAG: amylo-alpha-1,6-glucosidase [Ktedonobacterales bacterium]
MRITINSDTTFLISDEFGNIPVGTEFGLYQEDSRFLCRYDITLDGQKPLLLAANATESYAAMHFLTNPALPQVQRGMLSIIRRRAIGDELHEEIEVTNHSGSAAECVLALHADADFVHLFEVKHEVEVAGESTQRAGNVSRTMNEGSRSLSFTFRRDDFYRQLDIYFSEQPLWREDAATFALNLEPKETWRLSIDFVAQRAPTRTVRSIEDAVNGDGLVRSAAHPSQISEQRREHRAALLREAPRLETDSHGLQRGFRQSVRDFAALQIEGEGKIKGEFVIAAGIPWFMTLFGRDSLITAYQALPFYPDAAKGVLRALAKLQGTTVDRLRVEEPGKILHEYRSEAFLSTQKRAAVFPYYGTVDATPLFLMLLAAVYDVTGDLDFVRSLREPALRALEWMDRYGDRDGDGYLEYLKDVDAGLDNQGWKDSFDSIRHRDGSFAVPSIALCEVQGYAYAARLGMATVFDALGETERAAGLRHSAAALKARFNRDFWMPERNFYALALDRDKRHVDALTSNPGHLLWTGIADDDKARLIADRLLSPEFFTGWGIRTMAEGEGGYNPISYHCGSVWPHDNSLIVAGLAHYGFVEHAARVADALLHALTYYPDYRLPELFAGYGDGDAPFPVEYPTASRPQAWSTGAIFLLLSAMTGLDPSLHRSRERLFLLTGTHHLRLEGVWSKQRRINIEVIRSGATVVANQAVMVHA